MYVNCLCFFSVQFQMWKHIRSAMKPFGYFILFYFGKYLFYYLLQSLHICKRFPKVKASSTSADILDWYMNEYMVVAYFFPQIHFRSTWFTYGKFLKVIRIAVSLSVFSNYFRLECVYEAHICCRQFAPEIVQY